MGYIMHPVKEFKGLVTLLGKGKVCEHTAVILTLKLLFGKIHLPVGLIKHLLYLTVKGDIALLDLLIQKHEHINKGHAVGGKAVDGLGIILVIYRIGGIDKLCDLIIQVYKL